MHPIIFKIGPLCLYSWGFMVSLAFLAGLFTAIYFGKKEKISAQTILDLFIYVIISAIVGARVFYVIPFYLQFQGNIVSVLYIWEGGLVFFGGLIFSVMAVAYYVKIHRLKIWKLLDALSPATALGYSIGRIGCFLNGCCYGIVMFGVQQPTQIYSSISSLLIFIILFYLYRRKKYDGQIFLIALLLYSLYRFIIEFLRYSPFHISAFTPSQIIAFAVLILASYGLWKKNTI